MSAWKGQNGGWSVWAWDWVALHICSSCSFMGELYKGKKHAGINVNLYQKLEEAHSTSFIKQGNEPLCNQWSYQSPSHSTGRKNWHLRGPFVCVNPLQMCLLWLLVLEKIIDPTCALALFCEVLCCITSHFMSFEKKSLIAGVKTFQKTGFIGRGIEWKISLDELFLWEILSPFLVKSCQISHFWMPVAWLDSQNCFIFAPI